jgi:hypothetical protein
MPHVRHSVSSDGASTDSSSVAGGERVLVRFAGEADAAALEWLSQRDSCHLPPPPHLVAAVDGSIRAALSLSTGETIADPFTHTAHLREMLAVRAAQLDVRPRRQIAVLRWVRTYARGEAAL